MRMVYRTLFCLAAVAVLALTPPAASAAESVSASADKASVTYLPTVQLKDWQISSTQERYAFLMGFVAMLEMEHAWQGKETLPIGQSTVDTWVRGLSGVTIPQMDKALNEYMLKRPKAGERSVLEALGRIYVRPHLSKAEQETAGKRVEMLKAGFSK